jgi:hypothetical protein
MTAISRGALLGTLLLAVGLFGLSDVAGISPQSPQTKGTEQSPDLEALLAKTAEYCARLENAGLNFICLEEIQETIDPALDVNQPQDLFGDWDTRPATALDRRKAQIPRTTRIWHNVKKTYVYDYQCIRLGGAIREVRTLLKEDGKGRDEPNAVLKTSVVVFGTALLGPVGVLGARYQPDYDYTIIGRDTIDKHRVVVIDARPKPGAPETRNLYGKAWVDPATADILRIEWSESRVGRHEIFEKRAEKYKRTPRLTIRSDFSAEKNGIRFPSHLVVEEAYIGKSGGRFVRSKTDVTYKNFKFFTVEVEVGCATQGFRLIYLENGDKICSVAKAEES